MEQKWIEVHEAAEVVLLQADIPLVQCFGLAPCIVYRYLEVVLQVDPELDVVELEVEVHGRSSRRSQGCAYPRCLPQTSSVGRYHSPAVS